MIAGAYGYEVPPVPIPNTEVKLIHAEDTQMVTSRENRAAPALIIFISYSSIAQSVERMTVNHDVAGSSPAGGATKKPRIYVVCEAFLCFSEYQGHLVVSAELTNAMPSSLIS